MHGAFERDGLKNFLVSRRQFNGQPYLDSELRNAARRLVSHLFRHIYAHAFQIPSSAFSEGPKHACDTSSKSHSDKIRWGKVLTQAADLNGCIGFHSFAGWPVAH
jgi:hypothetical protein